MFNPSEASLTFFILWIVGIVGTVGVMLVFGVYRYQETQLQHVQKLEAMTFDHSKTLIKSQLDMQQLTFKNIARRIHSSIGIKLSFVESELSSLKFDKLDEVRTSISQIIAEFTQVIANVSDMSRSMSAELLKYYGLSKTLELEFETIRKKKIYIANMEIRGQISHLTPYEELIIFRMIQEGLSNITKHAKGNVIILNLHIQPDNFNFELLDNGVGFADPSNISFGFGLSNIRSRVQLLNGSWSLSNRSETSGTSLIINIPLTEENRQLTMTPFSELKKITKT